MTWHLLITFTNSSDQKCRACLDPFDTGMVFPKEFSENVNFEEKNQQTTKILLALLGAFRSGELKIRKITQHVKSLNYIMHIPTR